jgi:hypothetical protein
MIPGTIRLVAEFQDLPGAEGLSDRAWNRVQKKSNEEVALYLRDVIFPRRFTGQMRGPLHWANRSKRYEVRKAITKGHRKNHVFSGDTEDAFAAAPVRATVKFARVNVQGLNPGYGRRRKPGAIQLRDEITRFTPEEEKSIAEVKLKAVMRLIKEEIKRNTGRGGRGPRVRA